MKIYKKLNNKSLPGLWLKALQRLKTRISHPRRKPIVAGIFLFYFNSAHLITITIDMKAIYFILTIPGKFLFSIYGSIVSGC
jgi:hypothetical protein